MDTILHRVRRQSLAQLLTYLFAGIAVVVIIVDMVNASFDLEALSTLFAFLTGTVGTFTNLRSASPASRLSKRTIISLLLFVVVLVLNGGWLFTGAELADGYTNIANIVYGMLSVALRPIAPDPLIDANKREALLRESRARVEGFVEDRLLGGPWINLNIKYLPKEINRPDTTAIPRRDREDETETFESLITVLTPNFKGLLLLGKGGAGKTAALNQLSQALCEVASQDKHKPVPVIFNLAQWATKRAPISDWLVEVLERDFSIGKEIAQSWILDAPQHEGQVILPLLDGFDEVLNDKIGCFLAINEFCREHHHAVVIACRQIEYEALSDEVTKHKFTMNGEVACLNPLTPQQISDYLNTPQIKAKEAKNPNLELMRQLTTLNLIDSPLVLNILLRLRKPLEFQALAEASHAPENTEAETPVTDEANKELRERYERAILREFATYQLDNQESEISQKARTQLLWLAHKVKALGVQEFYIESLQPDWLPGAGWRVAYALISRLLSGLLTSIAIGWFFGNPLGLLPAGAIAGLAIGAVDSLRLQRAAPISFKQGWQQRLWQVGNVLTVALVVTLALTSFFSALEQHAAADMLFGTPIALSELIYALFLCFFFGTLFGVRGSWQYQREDLKPIEKLKWSTGAAIRGAIFYGGWVGIAIALIAFMIALTAPGSIIGSWLQNQTPPAEQLAIRSFLIGLVLGIGFGAAFGAMAKGYEISADDKKTPAEANKAFWLSLRNAGGQFLLMSTAFAVIFGVLFGSLHNWTPFGIWRGVTNGIGIGSLASLYYGGLDLVQHLTLRLLFYLQGLPFRYLQTLDESKKTTLLVRQGRGFVFLHNEIRDTLAERYPPHSAERLHAERLPRVIGLSAVAVVVAVLLFNIQALIYGRVVPPNAVPIQTETVALRDMPLTAGERIIIEAIGTTKLGSFVGNSQPEGTSTGMLGLPMDATYNIKNEPFSTDTLQFTHGVLLCRITAGAEPLTPWQPCAPPQRFQDAWQIWRWRTHEWAVTVDGHLEFRINDDDLINNNGSYWVTVQKAHGQ